MGKKLIKRYLIEVYEVDNSIVMDKNGIKEELAIAFKNLTEDQRRRHIQKLLDKKQEDYETHMRNKKYDWGTQEKIERI